jgi:hypothetical protein
MKKIAVVGSRSYNDTEKIRLVLSTILEHHGKFIMVSGGCKGPDLIAETWAKENNIDTVIFLPNWKKYGRAAGPIRNKDIVNECNYLIAFWDQKSKGTKSSIKQCEKTQTPYMIF